MGTVMKHNAKLASMAALAVAGCATGGGGHWDVVGHNTIMSEAWVQVWSDEIEAGVFPMLPDEVRTHYYASNPGDVPLCVQVVFNEFQGGGYRHSAMWRLEPGASEIEVAYGQAAMNDNFYIASRTYAWQAGAQGTPTDCSSRPTTEFFTR
jgi:hypothetical protein